MSKQSASHVRQAQCNPERQSNGSNGFTPIIILVGILILAGVAGAGYYLGKSSIPKPQPQNPVVTSVPQSSPTPVANPASTVPNEISNWKMYTNITYGLQFKYPANYIAADNIDPFLCSSLYKSESQQNCLVGTKFLIEGSQNEYIPHAYFYFLSKIDPISLPGQVDAISYDSKRKAWVLANVGGEKILTIWDYTKSGQEIIKTSNGGSHGSTYYYLIPDYKKDIIAIFMVPASNRLRCDLIENTAQQTQCNNFYNSIIQKYNNGQKPIPEDTWLPENYLKSLYIDTETMVKSFDFSK